MAALRSGRVALPVSAHWPLPGQQGAARGRGSAGVRGQRGACWRAVGPAAAAPLAACARRLRRGRHRSCSVLHAASTVAAEAEDRDVYGRALASSAATAQGVGADTVSRAADSVVKVFSAQCSPRAAYPWTNMQQRDTAGSAFYIEVEGQKLLMTNAHVVADAVFMELRRAGDAKRWVATRVRVSHECDLALLTVEEPEFWEGLRPLPFGDMPHLQDEVKAVGYPVGGDGVCVTQGVVSRVEVQQYAHSGRFLLAMQIDAAINPGNSGGPAVDNEGRVVGVAFQNQTQSQNIGYVIPRPIIEHFLNDADTDDPSKTRGFCSLGVSFQTLDNAQLRAFLGMGVEQTGILVTGLAPYTPTASVLQVGDVILELDGRVIANDGSFASAPKERLLFGHLINMKYSGESIDTCLLRSGSELSVRIPVAPVQFLVPTQKYDAPMPYFIYGGLLFLPLTRPYLQLWGDNWRADGPRDLLPLLDLWRDYPGEEAVVFSHVFPSQQTQGYSSFVDQRVLSVNGHKVENLAHMYRLVQRLHSSEAFLNIELTKRTGNQFIAIDTQAADAVNASVLQMNRIPAVASPELAEDTARDASGGGDASGQGGSVGAEAAGCARFSCGGHFA